MDIRSKRILPLAVALLSTTVCPLTHAAAAGAEQLERLRAYLEGYYRGVRSVHSFQSDDGPTLDCIDMFTQPAFNHAQLRDHQLQLRPSTELRDSALKEENLDIPARYSGELRGDTDALGNARSCPDGTVPIQRLTLDELSRFATLEEFLSKSPGEGVVEKTRAAAATGMTESPDPPANHTGPTRRHQYAYVREYIDNWGGETVLNLWAPYVERHDEFSLSQIWVARGGGDDLETVESGWQTYQYLNGDYKPHWFIYFTPDNYGSGGCYNLRCSGFVQVASNMYVGGVFNDTSVAGGLQYTFKLLWARDPATGNWWLKFNSTWVGYYPKALFDAKGLKYSADSLSYGGEITDRRTDGRHTRTDMGSGRFHTAGTAKAAYQRSIRYVDTSYTYRRHTGLFDTRDDGNCYDVKLYESTGSWGSYIYFGGPGYSSTYCN